MTEAAAPTDASPSGRRGSAFVAFIGLPFVIALSLGATAWWVDYNGFFARPPTSDAARYRLHALTMMQAFEGGGVIGWLKAGLAHDYGHQPTLPMVAGLIGAALGDVSPLACWLAEAVFGALLLLGVYRLAREFSGSWASLLAVVALASFPVVGTNLRSFYDQLPMTAGVVWTLFFLLRTDLFSRPGSSVLFGLTAGAAAMVKMLAPLYLFGATLGALIAGLCRPRRSRLILNAALACSGALAVLAPWYMRHWEKVRTWADYVVGEEGQRVYSNSVPVASIGRWLYYPRQLIVNGFGYFASVALAVALIIVLATCRRTASRRGLLLALNVVLGALVLIPGQTSSASFYVLPFVPLGAVLIASACDRLRSPIIRAAFAAAVLAASGWNQWLLSRPYSVDQKSKDVVAEYPETFRELVVRVFSPRIEHLLRAEVATNPETGAPIRESWPHREFVARMLANRPAAPPRVLMLTNLSAPSYFDPNMFDYEARRLRGQLSWIDYRVRQNERPPDPGALVVQADWLILDERHTPYAAADEFLTNTKVSHELIARHEVVPGTSIALLRIHAP